MINVDNIFGLFGSHDDLDGTDTAKSFIDFKETPIYWVGMYKKLILNHINFNKKFLQFFKKSNSELDIIDMKEAGEYITYNRAWKYINKIDLKNSSHLHAINHYKDEYLQTSLELGISYWVETEEYEKCAHLQKIIDFLKI
tara:strand:+ start:272 stop:694 length:423 start_codon:yes stop_codon:yes gene_type:complete